MPIIKHCGDQICNQPEEPPGDVKSRNMPQPPTEHSSLITLPAPGTLALWLRDVLPGFGMIDWVGATGSTNADLMQRARLQASRPSAMPWLLGAHRQTAGKGRAGRSWQSIEAAALMFSCAFDTSIPMAQLPGLSPALGVAACEALRAQCPGINDDRARRLGVKWPNDLQWGDAKLAGILVETARQPGARGPVVIVGMGLNLTGAAALTEQLARPIADWARVCQGSRLSQGADDTDDIRQTAGQLVACVALAWQQALKDYSGQGYAGFQSRFDRVDALAGQAVSVTDQGQLLQTGIAQGTDSTGRLLLATDHGHSPILVGDVSVRMRTAHATGL